MDTGEKRTKWCNWCQNQPVGVAEEPTDRLVDHGELCFSCQRIVDEKTIPNDRDIFEWLVWDE